MELETIITFCNGANSTQINKVNYCDYQNRYAQITCAYSDGKNCNARYDIDISREVKLFYIK